MVQSNPFFFCFKLIRDRNVGKVGHFIEFSLAPDLQMIHMNCQNLFSLKKKKNNNKMFSATNFAWHFNLYHSLG